MSTRDDRLRELSRLGFSKAVLDLSAGIMVTPLLRDICHEPYYIYQGGTTPSDLELTPIWQDTMMLTAVWVNMGRTEIIEYSLEAPEEFDVIAFTEQGLWAHVFANWAEAWA